MGNIGEFLFVKISPLFIGVLILIIIISALFIFKKKK